MKNFGVIGKIIKYMGYSLLLLTPSFVVFGQVFAASDGGYPWANAETIELATYDWGYRQCHPTMQSAQVCTAHTKYKYGVKYYLSDPWRYDVRNCTSYVAWRVNKDFGISIPGWGNANNWDNAASSKYLVDNTPQEGDIAVWEGLYGHVAFVTKVYPNGMFEVDQYNNAGTGVFSHQLRSSASHFIHVKPDSVAPVKTSATTKPQAAVAPKVENSNSPVTKPEPTIVEGTKVPVPLNDSTKSTFGTGPFPSTKDTDYLLGYSADIEEVNVYAVNHSNTKSGKVEINQTRIKDGNTIFQAPKVSSLAAAGDRQSKFVMGDYNLDKKLDLFVLEPTADNKQTEIVVLDGNSTFQQQLNKSTVNMPSDNLQSSTFEVANIKKKERPDIYKISREPGKTKTKFEVLDGAKKYTSVAKSWETNNAAEQGSDQYFVGDHDGDGQPDIYRSHHSSEDIGVSSVEVFDAKDNFQVASLQWVVGEPKKKADVVLPFIKIEESEETATESRSTL